MATTTEKKRGHFSRKNRQVIEFVAIPYGKKDETLFGALLQRILLRVLLLRKKVRLKYMMSNTFSSHCIKVVPFSLESILQSTNVKGMFKNPPFLPDSHIHEKQQCGITEGVNAKGDPEGFFHDYVIHSVLLVFPRILLQCIRFPKTFGLEYPVA